MPWKILLRSDDHVQRVIRAVTSSFYALQDAAYQVKNALDDLEYDAERLNEVEQRLALISKYEAQIRHDRRRNS